ncbi:unnamed protein product, partial [Staurois parvus]
PAVHPPVPLCSQCHPPVPTHLCPPVPSAASQCSQSVPSGCASQCRHQCRLSVPIISAAYQCCILVPPIRDTSLVLPISAAYPCHLISTAYQCPLVLSVPPISASSSTHISEGEKLPV